MKTRRYGAWAGCPDGLAEDPKRCAVEVSDSGGWLYHQCRRPRKYGELCGVHEGMRKRMVAKSDDGKHWLKIPEAK
jgi:hypothetical protein